MLLTIIITVIVLWLVGSAIIGTIRGLKLRQIIGSSEKFDRWMESLSITFLILHTQSSCPVDASSFVVKTNLSRTQLQKKVDKIRLGFIGSASAKTSHTFSELINKGYIYQLTPANKHLNDLAARIMFLYDYSSNLDSHGDKSSKYSGSNSSDINKAVLELRKNHESQIRIELGLVRIMIVYT